MNKFTESIKTVVLWLLFAIAIALVAIRYTDFGNTKSDAISPFLNQRYFKQMLLPSHIIVSFDNLSKTQILNKQSNYYDEAIENLVQAFSSKKSFEEVELSTFDTLSSSKMVSFIFNNFPGSIFGLVTGINDNDLTSRDNIVGIHFAIGENTIFIQTDKKIFSLLSERINGFSSVDSLMETNYQRYVPIFYPMNSNKNLLLPIKPDIYMQDLASVNLLNDTNISEIANNIFNEKFDFTSSIVQKNGIYFYSYNNGEQILEISKNGHIKYKSSANISNSNDYTKAATALSKFLVDAKINPDLIKIKKIYKFNDNGTEKIRFEMVGKYLGIDLVTGNKSYVDVVNSDVVDANLSLIYAAPYSSEFNSLIDQKDALSDNIDVLKKFLMVDDSTQLLKQIRDFNLNYLFDDMSGNYIPCWSFEIGGYIFYFDGISGEMVHYAMD